MEDFISFLACSLGLDANRSLNVEYKSLSKPALAICPAASRITFFLDVAMFASTGTGADTNGVTAATVRTSSVDGTGFFVIPDI